jgi:hypothetical protein
MNPQFTYDNKGNAIGVFLPIEDWEQLQQSLPPQTEELPQWKRELIDSRLQAIAANPARLHPVEELYEELDKEEE